MDTLHRLAKALLERETLDGKDIDAIMQGDGREVKEPSGAEEA